MKGSGSLTEMRLDKMYLALLKKCLTRSIAPREPLDSKMRSEGRDWPADAETMIGLKRLDNLQFCVERILEDGVEGDLIEAGVWRGGASIFMRGALKAHGDPTRVGWVADSFQGLPAP